jgi:hypothetical protein
MCTGCSRRALLAGGALALLLNAGVSGRAATSDKFLCGLESDHDLDKIIATKSSMPKGDARFHPALIDELKGILDIVKVDPGFQYVEADNAFATRRSYVRDTKGTIFIGTSLVRELLESSDGGVAVAGLLAHECVHIFQFYSPYNERLNGKNDAWYELHADVMAGYYLAKKIGTAAKRLNGLQQQLIKKGTYNERNPRYHGPGGYRSASLDKGYLLGQSKLSFLQAAEEAEQFVKNLIN